MEKGKRAALKLIADLKAYLFGSQTPKAVYRDFGIDARDAIHPPCQHFPTAYQEIGIPDLHGATC